MGTDGGGRRTHPLSNVRPVNLSPVTADELYRFVLANAEEIDGQLVCRASLIAELRRRGVEFPGRVRARLVRELTERGLVLRPHPRSTSLIVLDLDGDVQTKLRSIAHQHFMDRMASWSEPGAIEILSVPYPRYDHDERGAQERLGRLQTYLQSNVLANKDFICSSWGGCETSIAPGCTFKEGQLSHIGKHYDLTREGRPVRIVVVGQEVGAKGKARTTMAERYANVHDGSGMKKRFVSDGAHPSRNPHMKGTTLALRTIFGTGPTTEREGEFINVNGEEVHMFDCFALVNRLLCAAHVAGTSTGKSTKTMLQNCERHFRATLEILDPTIVVLQGVRMWKWSKNVLVPQRRVTDHLLEARLRGQEVMVATLTHPSARDPYRWDSPQSAYFKEVVRPTLERAVKAL